MDPELKSEIRKVGKNFELTLSCTRPAFWISLDQGAIKGTFSDNFFSIRPTAPKTVTFVTDEEVSLENFKAAFSMMDLYTEGV
jgi:hypothetical protein